VETHRNPNGGVVQLKITDERDSAYNPPPGLGKPDASGRAISAGSVQELLILYFTACMFIPYTLCCCDWWMGTYSH